MLTLCFSSAVSAIDETSWGNGAGRAGEAREFFLIHAPRRGRTSIFFAFLCKLTSTGYRALSVREMSRRRDSVRSVLSEPALMERDEQARDILRCIELVQSRTPRKYL